MKKKKDFKTIDLTKGPLTDKEVNDVFQLLTGHASIKYLNEVEKTVRINIQIPNAPHREKNEQILKLVDSARTCYQLNTGDTGYYLLRIKELTTEINLSRRQSTRAKKRKDKPNTFRKDIERICKKLRSNKLNRLLNAFIQDERESDGILQDLRCSRKDSIKLEILRVDEEKKRVSYSLNGKKGDSTFKNIQQNILSKIQTPQKKNSIKI